MMRPVMAPRATKGDIASGKAEAIGEVTGEPAKVVFKASK